MLDCLLRHSDAEEIESAHAVSRRETGRHIKL